MIWNRVPLALAGLVLPLAANAQVMFDTTRVTCADYLAMSPNDARLFSAFISGWFNQKTGHVTVDLNEYERNVANVRSWCATIRGRRCLPVSSAQPAQAADDHQGQLDHEPKTIAIAALLAASSAAPAGAQTIVDMSLISCDQFLKSPQERKDVLSAWMGGYYSAMKNLATIDARYVVRNSKKIANYCRTARNETLMSATQRNWR